VWTFRGCSASINKGIHIKHTNSREFKAKLEITATDSKVILSFRAH
jgi:hypothetical protein